MPRCLALCANRAKWAPKLAIDASREAIRKWGGDKNAITHIIFHSCTGFKAPGVELDVVDALNLTGIKRRLGINYMGCFGGFTGLNVAKSYALSSPNAVVLLVCVEICSCHMTLSENRSESLGNAVFSDGGAAVIIGAGRRGDWAIGSQETHTLGKESRSHMLWAPSNHAYNMFLDKSISTSLGMALFMNAKKYMRGEHPRPAPLTTIELDRTRDARRPAPPSFRFLERPSAHVHASPTLGSRLPSRLD